MAKEKRIALVGVGGGGLNLLEGVLNHKIDIATSIAINRDERALSLSSAYVKIFLDSPKNDESHILNSVRIHESSIVSLLENVETIVIVACLGGMTGSYASGEVARIAQNKGVYVAAIVTEPFNFEGTQRAIDSKKGLKLLSNHVSLMVCLPNQNLIYTSKNNTSMLEAFGEMDKTVLRLIKIISDKFN